MQGNDFNAELESYFVFYDIVYTLLIISDAWRQLVKGSLFLFKTKQKASLYFTNWRQISGIINKVYTTPL